MGRPAGEPEPVTVEPPAGLPAAALGMAFSDVAFLHWAYEPDEVGPLLPGGTRADCFDGAAYVGIVAFRMRSYGEFLEFNVRTYTVDAAGRRGVVFLTMEADRLSWVLTARAAGLPYRWARMSLSRDTHTLDYRSRRRRWGAHRPGLHVRLRVGPPIAGEPLDHFLTARWRMHHRLPGATVVAGLAHDRWPLHAADLLDVREDLIAATGLRPPAGPPVSVRYAPRVEGRMGLPRVARGDRA